MCQRMLMYHKLNNLSCKEQSGFRKYHGTFNPITELCMFISRKFNEGKFVICIFIDLAKAFNSLNWEILSKKLLNLGFTGMFHKLLHS